MEALPQSTNITMTSDKGTVDIQTPCNTNTTQDIQKLLRDELLRHRSKLALDIPDEKLLTGIDIATGCSSLLVENIVRNVGKLSLATMKTMFNFSVKSMQLNHGKC